MTQRLALILAFFFALPLFSCKNDSNPTIPPPGTDTTHTIDTTKKLIDTVYTASYSTINADTSFGMGVALGNLDVHQIPEASGLAASRHYPGMLWTHNDSGNPNDIFLIDSAANIRGIFSLLGCGNRDWEDIAIGPGPDPTKDYIYVGDIGDNKSSHATTYIYRFPEPTDALSSGAIHITITAAQTITFTYPDGPRNAETLMIDPLTKDIYVASKANTAGLYVARYPQRTDSTFTLTKLAILPLTTLTAGDISSSGSEILMKNYEAIYYWKRATGESILTALLRTPSQVSYTPEVQGESVCFSPNANAYYTTSEYANNYVPAIFRYLRK